MVRLSFGLLLLLTGCGLEEKGALPAGSAAGAAGAGGTIAAPDGGDWFDGGAGAAGTGGAAAGAAGSGGQPGGAGGGGGAAGAAGITGAEDCQNGKDDDGDKAVDCADPDCGAFQCFGQAPTGWTGPVALYQGPDPAPDCSASGGYATLKHDGGALQVGATVCPTCTCDAAGVTCTAATFTTYNSTGCTGTELVKGPISSCSSMSASSAPQNSIKMTLPPAGGSCAPQESGSQVIPAPTFSPVARLCASDAVGAGCPKGQVCTPSLVGPFTKICIYKAGVETTCPAGYASPEQVTVGFTDSRSCAACTCQKGCSYNAQVTDWACGGAQFSTLSSNGACGSAGGQWTLGVAVSAKRECTPSGGPGGGVEPIQVTVCCAL